MSGKTYDSAAVFQGKTAEEIRAICEEAVSHPGRLEAESPVTAYFHALAAEYGDESMDVTDDDREIFPELAGVGAVVAYTDDSGFCYLSRHESIDEAEEAASDLRGDEGEAEWENHTSPFGGNK